MTSSLFRIAAAATALAILVSSAQAAPTPAQRCAAAKIKAAGKAVSSRCKCEQKGITSGTAADADCVDKADGKLADAFLRADDKGGCEVTGDRNEVQADVDACIASFRTAIGGDAKCSSAKMKAVGKTTSSVSNCRQSGILAGGSADAGCLAKAHTKLEGAVDKADGAGTCTDTATALQALIDACVTNLATPATTTTTLAPTTTTTLEPTTTTSTTTTTIPVPTGDWVRCAHAGETCVLPRHDQLVSFQGIPPATPYVTTISGKSVECSPSALFPGQPLVAGLTGDCYFYDIGCSYDIFPIGVVVSDQFVDPEVNDAAPSVFVLHNPPYFGECFVTPSTTLCDLENPMSANYSHTIEAFVIDPRVCGPDDRAHVRTRFELHYPPGEVPGNPVFAPQGISGYLSSRLSLDQEQTMPSLDQATEPKWRLHLEIYQDDDDDFAGTPYPYTLHRMRFRYVDAVSEIGHSTTCQLYYSHNSNCLFDQLLHVPEGEY